MYVKKGILKGRQLHRTTTRWRDLDLLRSLFTTSRNRLPRTHRSGSSRCTRRPLGWPGSFSPAGSSPDSGARVDWKVKIK